MIGRTQASAVTFVPVLCGSNALSRGPERGIPFEDAKSPVPHAARVPPQIGQMGCLSRLIGTAVFLVGALVAAWWWSGGQVPLPQAIESRIPFNPRGADSMSTAPTGALATARWQPITEAGSTSAQAQLARLSRRDGPATVTLEAGELASFLVKAFAQQLPATASGARVAVINDMVYVKSEIPLEDFGGSAILGPLAGALNRKDTITIGGQFDLISSRTAQFRIREVVIGEFGVPKPLLPKLVSSTRRGTVGSDISDDGYPVELPPYVGDVRISRGRITVYRADPLAKP